MEIERINDNTVKFYMSYVDIEKRGFDREEIWYNREKSEELFWEVMDEVHEEEEFTIEGPLWIQVQALDKGLEILVTKAQLTKEGQRFDLPIFDEKFKDMPVDERIEEILDQHFSHEDEKIDDFDELGFTILFRDFEDVITLSKQEILDDIHSKLFSFEGNYYLYIEFSEHLFDESNIDDYISVLLEYGEETPVTIHRLEEYGKVIVENDVFRVLRKYFS